MTVPRSLNKLPTFSIIALTIGILTLDIFIPLGVAGGVPYVVPVMLAHGFKTTRDIFIVAIVCSALTILGLFLSPSGNLMWMVYTNRFLALFAIWVTAILTARSKRNEQALENEREGLENAVKERTEELRDFNANLEQEVEEHKQAEVRLKEAHQRISVILKTVGEGVVVIGADSRIHYMNQELLRIFGYQMEELLGHHIGILMPEKYRAPHDEGVKKYLQGGAPKILGRRIELEGLHKDGSVFPIELRVEETKIDEGAQFFTAAIRDMSVRIKYRAERAERAKRMQKLSELSMTLAGDPMEVFNKVSRMIGDLLDVSVVCLSEIRGDELHFLSVYVKGEIINDAGFCPLDITPCSTVEKDKEIRIFEKVAEKFPEAGFLKTHNAFSYCGFPAIDSSGDVVAVTCLLDDKPHDFSDEDKDLLKIFGQRIAVEMERKQAQEALSESEEKFRALIETTSDWVWEVDMNGVYTYVSPKIKDLLGYDPDEIIGKTPFDLMPPDEVERVGAIFGSIVNSQKPFAGLENVNLHKDGRKLTLETSGVPFFDSKGNLLGYRGIDRDITDWKEKQEGLTRLVTAVESAAEIICITDGMGIIQYVNMSYESITGYSQEEIINKSLKNLFRSNEFSFESLWEVIIKGDVWDGRLASINKGGGSLEVEATVSPIKSESGAILGYVAIMRDVTNEAMLEKQYRQAQKMEALGTLAGGIAHDFNNILSSIMCNADLAMDYLPEKSEGYGDLKKILSATKRARDLIQRILLFSGGDEKLSSKPISLQPVLKESLEIIRSSLPKTIRIIEDIDINAGATLGNPTQISQVLINLCANAGHAMKETGGQLAVSLKEVEVAENEAYAHPVLQVGPYIKVEVRDTGHGIDKKVMEHIFEPFYTTKKAGEGSGLGLATVHGIVTGYGGAITVESEPGKGAVFSIFFPKVEEKVKEEFKPDDPKNLEGTERILLVDDEKDVAEGWSSMLEKLGYSVAIFIDPVEALNVFREDPKRFDLLITDQSMQHMTGDTLGEEIMRLRPEMPMILCTGFSNAADTKKVKAIGFIEFISKPVSNGELAQVVRNVIDSSHNGAR